MSQETLSVQVKPYNQGDFGMGAAIKTAFSHTFSGEFIRACSVWLLLAFAIGTLLPALMGISLTGGAAAALDPSLSDPSAAGAAALDPAAGMDLVTSSIGALIFIIAGSLLSGLGVAAVSVGVYRRLSLQEKPGLFHLGMREFWYFILPFLYLIPVAIIGGILFWLVTLLGLGVVAVIAGVLLMIALIFVFPPYYMLFMSLVSFDMKQKERWAVTRAILSGMPVSVWVGYIVLMLLAMVLVFAAMLPLGLVATTMAVTAAAEGAASNPMGIVIAGGLLNLIMTFLNVGLFVSYTGHILKVRAECK